MSTHCAIYIFFTNVITSLESCKCVSRFDCDLSKALDCIDYQILLNELEYYGIRGTLLKWYKSYSLNRKQGVTLKQINEKRFAVQNMS